MSDKPVVQSKGDVLARVIIEGDLSALTNEQRVEYYGAVCNSIGLNPLTKPFEYIKLNGRLTLYALKGATEQLAQIHNVSVKLSEPIFANGCYIVRATAVDPSNREATATGVVAIEGLKGEALANAMMKAETKAHRRAVLRHQGLGMLDESEAESLPASAYVHEAQVVDDPCLLTRVKSIITELGIDEEEVVKGLVNYYGLTDLEELTLDQLADLEQRLHARQPALVEGS